LWTAERKKEKLSSIFVQVVYIVHIVHETVFPINVISAISRLIFV